MCDLLLGLDVSVTSHSGIWKPGSLTMLDEIEPDAADYRNFIRGHGTQQSFHSSFLICNLSRGVEDIVVSYIDNLCL